MLAQDVDITARCEELAKADTEHAHQRALFARLAYAAYTGECPAARWAYAIPNGGKRDQITAARLKAEGVKAGVPDVHYPVSNGVFLTLYIELKRKGGRRSDSQNEWHSGLRACGHTVVTCWGWRAAWLAFTDYDANNPMQEEYR